MSSFRRSERVSLVVPTRQKKRKADVLSNVEKIVEKREALLQERKTKLESVVDKHDALVREAFHLEHFVSLLSYNPQEAKADITTVFQHYQAKHDLFSNLTAGAGSSRRTRQAQHIMSRSIHASGSSFPQPNTRKSARNDTEAKHKGKANASPVRSNATESLSVSLNMKGKAFSAEYALLDETIVKHALPNASSASTLRKRRKTFHATSEETLLGTFDLQTSQPRPLESTSPLALGRRTRQARRNTDFSHELPGPQLIEEPKPLLRKIKLIVRQPALALSHPAQKPCPPSFNASIPEFLSSYVSLNHGKDVDVSALEALAKRHAAIYSKRDRFIREGRMFVGFDPSFSNQVEKELPREEDVWDLLVGEVIARDQVEDIQRRQLVINHIVTDIKAYWVVQAAKQDKLRALEEKRLRALAKETVKLVVNEWKRAVLFIRQQERLNFEAVERKRGDLHLDAILNQSGHILEAQQIELAKTGDKRAKKSSPSSSTLHKKPALSESGDDVEEQPTAKLDMEVEEDSEDDITEEEEENAETAELLGIPKYMDYSDRSSNSPFPRELGIEDALTDVDDGSRRVLSHSPHSSFDNFPPKPLTEPLAIHAITPDDDRTDRDPASITDFFPSYGTRSDEGFPSAFDDFTTSTDTSTKRSGDFFRTSDVESEAVNPFIISQEPEDILPNPPENLLNPDTHQTPNDTAEHVVNPEIPPSKANVEINIGESEENPSESSLIPAYLKPFAVTPVDCDTTKIVEVPPLLRGLLRPYQKTGLDWMVSLHTKNLNGILADEMGLGKTIQTIALLAHLACDKGIWGPHLIIVPTSVLLNWEMEFKKFLPGFKVLSYHGNTKRRKELRQGWKNKFHFNVCITSYTLASRDAHIFKRKSWYYMCLDEAHMIKNFRSQRWNTLLMFRSFRRLLLTGTPLQNNLTELWALLQFLMSGTDFANLKEFGEWFSAPLEKAVEMGDVLDDDTQQRVSKLHTVLRPYLLRRLKRDVEKELPSKFEHLILCPLSKRQRFLYDEFMSRAETRHDLKSGVYQKIANILMQLRKVCNHPDLFEVRPVVTSFTMNRSAVADYEIKELLVRRQLFKVHDEDQLNMRALGLNFINGQDTPLIAAVETRRLDGTSFLHHIHDIPGEPPPRDTRTIQGFKHYREFQLHKDTIARWDHIRYLNRLRCSHLPIYSRELITAVRTMHQPLLPLSAVDQSDAYTKTVFSTHAAVKPYSQRSQEMAPTLDRFAFATPAVVAKDIPRIVFSGHNEVIARAASDSAFDEVLHRASVKLQIAFPDPSLLQYDCGKLQELSRLLRRRKAGGHRVLIFTQMTRILDILELFLSFHGYLYLRLDGATKIEDRQYITERFNSDPKVFCFIASSRSGGVGINLTGADTVIFYDSDFNPQMDKQCEDRAHRIGQIRDVHIYRFISEYTVEEALLRKANQKRTLNDLVIQKGEFDWKSLLGNESALNSALALVEDTDDAHAAALATREALALEGADEADFGGEARTVAFRQSDNEPELPLVEDASEETGEGGTCIDYMLNFIQRDTMYFRD